MVVDEISQPAREALREAGIHYELGYGDVYHFDEHIPGMSSDDISKSFALGDTQFVIMGSRLMLVSEIGGEQEILLRLASYDVKNWKRLILELQAALPDCHLYPSTGLLLVKTCIPYGNLFDLLVKQNVLAAWHTKEDSHE